MFENMFVFRKFIKNLVDIDNKINKIIKNHKPKIKTECYGKKDLLVF